MRELVLIWWWSRLHRRHVRELAEPSRIRFVRPILGVAAVLGLVAGGVTALSFDPAPRRDPGQRQWTICMPVVMQPPPTAAGTNHAVCPRQW
ncbi:hypothetical protein [Nocardia brasiliensis]|uniref:hypothetical protein n=1 Tax=Nocardia brasiliensis TaxID=37326 RepID=UPI0018946340|nr:hypothetical protein [Nocardia brasiliensis]MBF6541676.1 hypothetical protein [Nocardia brasiliensis]